MKSLRLTLILFIVLPIFGCAGKEPLSIKKVIVAGKIIHQEKYPNNYTIKVFENNLVNSMGNYHTSFIEDDGSFKIEFEKSFPSDVYLIYGSLITLFVNPGDSVYIEADANELINPNPESLSDFKSLKFSGSNQQLNNEIKLFLPFIYKSNAMAVNNNERTLLPEDYLNYLKGKNLKEIQTLDSLIKTRDFSEKFVKWSHLLIDYDFAARIFHYTWVYPFFNYQGKKKFESIDIPESFYNAIKDITINNSEAIINGNYPRFLHEYFMANTFKKSEFGKKKRTVGRTFYESEIFQDEFEKYLKIIQQDYDGIASEILISQNLYDLLDSYKRIDVYENLYPEYKNNLRSSFFAILDNKYLEIKLAQISPDKDKSTVKEENGIEVAANDILKKIMDRNKGKIVLLDFWATWCGPCLMEFEHSKKLAKKYDGKSIEFVFICVKSEKDNWEDRIREYNLPGSQYLLNDSEYDMVSQKFQIVGIPHYVLIDKSGIVVDQNAPHPSNASELSNLIEKYID